MRPSIATIRRKAGYLNNNRHRDANGKLTFRPLTAADPAKLSPLLATATTRTCDFTVGGIMMWDRYFDYTMAIADETLFIKGLCESDRTRPAFSLPVGKMPLPEAVGLLREYCRTHRMPLMLSAVPEQYVGQLVELGATGMEEIPDWADYLYDIHSLATLAGKKMSKKRNHVNHFAAEHPDAQLVPLTPDRIDEAVSFVEHLGIDPSKPEIAHYEFRETLDVVRNLAVYPFEGALLTVPGIGIVGLTVAEVVGDTLHVHIEKINHEVSGAGETLASRFAAMMLERHPQLSYENRQDDSGDPGLRQAKLSWNPCAVLRKFNLSIPL